MKDEVKKAVRLVAVCGGSRANEIIKDPETRWWECIGPRGIERYERREGTSIGVVYQFVPPIVPQTMLHYLQENEIVSFEAAPNGRFTVDALDGSSKFVAMNQQQLLQLAEELRCLAEGRTFVWPPVHTS